MYSVAIAGVCTWSLFCAFGWTTFMNWCWKGNFNTRKSSDEMDLSNRRESAHDMEHTNCEWILKREHPFLNWFQHSRMESRPRPETTAPSPLRDTLTKILWNTYRMRARQKRVVDIQGRAFGGWASRGRVSGGWFVRFLYCYRMMQNEKSRRHFEGGEKEIEWRHRRASINIPQWR